MCGIVGSVGIRSEASVFVGAVHRLRHRGPDDEGSVWVDENVFLGHRRLKVIDLSDRGRQPMCNEDGTVWIVYNGETYNYRTLKESLSEKGHCFKSATDTEVIVHLYEEKKEACFEEMNGMFALAIYDKPRKKLFLARDRLGIKPLYYYCGNGQFIFASEIKAILDFGTYSPDVNWQAFYDYLTYLYIPCPDTMFRGIFQLPPGHVLEFDVQTRERTLRRYWQIAGPGDLGVKGSFQEHRDGLRKLIKDSVHGQMVSEVPLGVFLSGGVDSPILTGLMAQESSRRIKTFTVIFGGENVKFYDERDEARAVAHRFGTEHHEIRVQVGNPLEMLDLVEFFDQPFGNPTFYLMYLISRETRREVTVALCGAGGDELFAGYPRYRAMALSRWCRLLPSPVLISARKALGLVADRYQTMTLRRARQFLEGLGGDFSQQFVKWTYFFDEERKKLLLNSNGRLKQFTDLLPCERIVQNYLNESPLQDFGNRVLHTDLQTFLPDNILEYTDKMSMASGLEVRVPYLDHRVVEHSLRIPFDYKLRGAKNKIILREAFADLYPKLNRQQAKKGFNAPLAVWMRDDLDRYFDRSMTHEKVDKDGIFNWEYLQSLRWQHSTGRRDNSYELFSVMMFDVWYRRYILQEAQREAA